MVLELDGCAFEEGFEDSSCERTCCQYKITARQFCSRPIVTAGGFNLYAGERAIGGKVYIGDVVVETKFDAQRFALRI
jgi:hypothetical protein